LSKEMPGWECRVTWCLGVVPRQTGGATHQSPLCSVSCHDMRASCHKNSYTCRKYQKRWKQSSMGRRSRNIWHLQPLDKSGGRRDLSDSVPSLPNLMSTPEADRKKPTHKRLRHDFLFGFIPLGQWPLTLAFRHPLKRTVQCL
jgi:hypothetical protein